MASTDYTPTGGFGGSGNQYNGRRGGKFGKKKTAMERRADVNGKYNKEQETQSINRDDSTMSTETDNKTTIPQAKDVLPDVFGNFHVGRQNTAMQKLTEFMLEHDIPTAHSKETTAAVIKRESIERETGLDEYLKNFAKNAGIRVSKLRGQLDKAVSQIKVQQNATEASAEESAAEETTAPVVEEATAAVKTPKAEVPEVEAPEAEAPKVAPEAKPVSNKTDDEIMDSIMEDIAAQDKKAAAQQTTTTPVAETTTPEPVTVDPKPQEHKPEEPTRNTHETRDLSNQEMALASLEFLTREQNKFSNRLNLAALQECLPQTTEDGKLLLGVEDIIKAQGITPPDDPNKTAVLARSMAEMAHFGRFCKTADNKTFVDYAVKKGQPAPSAQVMENLANGDGKMFDQYREQVTERLKEGMANKLASETGMATGTAQKNKNFSVKKAFIAGGAGFGGLAAAKKAFFVPDENGELQFSPKKFFQKPGSWAKVGYKIVAGGVRGAITGGVASFALSALNKRVGIITNNKYTEQFAELLNLKKSNEQNLSEAYMNCFDNAVAHVDGKNMTTREASDELTGEDKTREQETDGVEQDTADKTKTGKKKEGGETKEGSKTVEKTKDVVAEKVFASERAERLNGHLTNFMEIMDMFPEGSDAHNAAKAIVGNIVVMLKEEQDKATATAPEKTEMTYDDVIEAANDLKKDEPKLSGDADRVIKGAEARNAIGTNKELQEQLASTGAHLDASEERRDKKQEPVTADDLRAQQDKLYAQIQDKLREKDNSAAATLNQERLQLMGQEHRMREEDSKKLLTDLKIAANDGQLTAGQRNEINAEYKQIKEAYAKQLENSKGPDGTITQKAHTDALKTLNKGLERTIGKVNALAAGKTSMITEGKNVNDNSIEAAALAQRSADNIAKREAARNTALATSN